jgi:hypothetical protein
MGVTEDNQPTDTHYLSGPCGCIGHIYPDRETPTGMANAEANARLIAAAPEMLEALLEIERGLSTLDAARIAAKAIAKATGGAG